MLSIKLPWAKSHNKIHLKSAQTGPLRFGLISYRESNLGDDIQAFAALQFMPRVDHYIQRDEVGNFAASLPNERVKIVMNGWFMGSRSWPPAPSLEPLFVSFHLGQHRYGSFKDWGGKNFLLSKKSLDYFKAHGPIGCRDTTTSSLLQANGVDAYFSGCLTLTLGSLLKHRADPPSREEILFVDPDLDHRALFDSVPLELKHKVAFVTHATPLISPPELRLSTVASMLQRYASAKLVITSRLHCALPCLALETPVIFVPPKVDLDRFAGIWELLNVARVSDGKITETIPWVAPAPNPDKYRELARNLSKACQQFFLQPEGH